VCLAVPGEVVSVSERDGLPFGRVRFGTVERDVCLVHVPDVGAGDFVLVHVGFAIQRLDRKAAEATLALFADALRGVEPLAAPPRPGPQNETPRETPEPPQPETPEPPRPPTDEPEGAR
jgi:hydrogenase expression/formation protein HypC